MKLKIPKDKEYRDLLTRLKETIRSSQIKAAVSVNRALMECYWIMGKMIVEKQAAASWGDGYL